MSDVTPLGIQLEDARWAAVIENDLDAMRKLLADELSYTHSKGAIDTKSSFLSSIEDGVFDYQAVEHITRTSVEVGSTVMINGQANVRVVVRGNALDLHIAYSVVWIERGGGHQLLCWQSTPLPEG